MILCKWWDAVGKAICPSAQRRNLCPHGLCHSCVGVVIDNHTWNIWQEVCSVNAESMVFVGCPITSHWRTQQVLTVLCRKATEIPPQASRAHQCAGKVTCRCGLSAPNTMFTVSYMECYVLVLKKKLIEPYHVAQASLKLRNLSVSSSPVLGS